MSQLALMSHNVTALKKVKQDYRNEVKKLIKETGFKHWKLKCKNFRKDILKSLPAFLLLVVCYVMVGILNNDFREFEYIIYYDAEIFERAYECLSAVV